MPITFNAAPSYFWLDTWVLANIIEIATQDFCDRFIDFTIDPGRRLYDQMVMAARSIRANIAEGSGRHETSFETEMRLTDVARASAHELMGDYMNYIIRHKLSTWNLKDPKYQSTYFLKLAKPHYGENFITDSLAHIAAQKARFDCFLVRGTVEDAANCLLVLCLKIIAMLTRMLSSQLSDFNEQGGFTENLTQSRLQAQREKATEAGAPACPRCGSPIIRRTIKRGSRQGQEFWGCSNYPSYPGTLNIPT